MPRTSSLRATSRAGITRASRLPTRVEHWTNAVDQAGSVAHNLVHPGDPMPYAPVPYVWTDQHGWKFQIVGHPENGSRHEVVGDLGADRPRAALLYEDAEGRLAGALTLNWPRALAECRRGLAERIDARVGDRLPLGSSGNRCLTPRMSSSDSRHRLG